MPIRGIAKSGSCLNQLMTGLHHAPVSHNPAAEAPIVSSNNEAVPLLSFERCRGDPFQEYINITIATASIMRSHEQKGGTRWTGKRGYPSEMSKAFS
jgi:hypothetical protein